MIPTPFQYPGSKVRLSEKLPAPLPDVPIVEAFAGAAGYSARYGAHRVVHLVDNHPVVCGAWRFILNASEEDVLALPATLALGWRPGIDMSLEAAVRPYLALWANPTCRPHSITPVSPRGHGGHSCWSERVRERQARVLGARKRWSITESSYLDAPDIRATWVIDPPYEMVGQNCYASSIDWSELGSFIASRRGLVIVTTEPCSGKWLPGGHSTQWTVERKATLTSLKVKRTFSELVTVYGLREFWQPGFLQ